MSYEQKSLPLNLPESALYLRWDANRDRYSLDYKTSSGSYRPMYVLVGDYDFSARKEMLLELVSTQELAVALS